MTKDELYTLCKERGSVYCILIDGQLYEIKGNQFFEGDKMINPYDRGQDGLYEAKHQCMLNNGVIILKVEDIKRLNQITA